MQISSRHIAIFSIVALAIACGRDATAPRRTGNEAALPLDPPLDPPINPPPHAVGLVIVPASPAMALGTSFVPSAFKVMSDSSRYPVTATWGSSNRGILYVHPYTGYAVAVGPGTVTLRAEGEGLVGGASITVSTAKSYGSDVLVVDSFSVVEHQYSSGSDWWYAPQIRVHALPGRKAVVLTMEFNLPGFAASFPCGGKVGEAARELNGEVYGDPAFEMGTGSKRVTADEASAVITFIDDAGAMFTRTVGGPIVRGSGPAYDGDPGACFHGYGATG